MIQCQSADSVTAEVIVTHSINEDRSVIITNSTGELGYHIPLCDSGNTSLTVTGVEHLPVTLNYGGAPSPEEIVWLSVIGTRYVIVQIPHNGWLTRLEIMHKDDGGDDHDPNTFFTSFGNSSGYNKGGYLLRDVVQKDDWLIYDWMNQTNNATNDNTSLIYFNNSETTYNQWGFWLHQEGLYGVTTKELPPSNQSLVFCDTLQLNNLIVKLYLSPTNPLNASTNYAINEILLDNRSYSLGEPFSVEVTSSEPATVPVTLAFNNWSRVALNYTYRYHFVKSIAATVAVEKANAVVQFIVPPEVFPGDNIMRGSSTIEVILSAPAKYKGSTINWAGSMVGSMMGLNTAPVESPFARVLFVGPQYKIGTWTVNFELLNSGKSIAGTPVAWVLGALLLGISLEKRSMRRRDA
jgi:hypothetical protein